MSARLFGTDGVRGVAGHDLTARLAMDLSQAAAQVLSKSKRPVAAVGRDPRASGEFLEAAVVAGLAGAGVDVLRLGVLPTPGVAYLTGALAADFGVVISASHNPAEDNGIKFFGPHGVKLPDAVEDEIEAVLISDIPVTTREFGRVTDATAEHARYVDYLLNTLPAGQARPLSNMKLVVDCANGAAYAIAPEVLRRAGAQVIAIGAEPDGLNINKGCGSTHLSTLAAAVREHGADGGIAYDGDADRCLAVDETGEPLEGDEILTILATELKDEGRLAGNAIVVTVMSNQGLHAAMHAAGIAVIETPVGDKHVSAAMRDGGYMLGGEQSGHIIMMEHSSTGDGVLTSLQLLAAVSRRGLAMSQAAAMMPRYPQLLLNVPGDGSRLGPGLAAAVSRAESQLGRDGRVLVRPSGTEPKIRLMVQAKDASLAEQVIGQLADAVRLALADS
ncbi:MAG TPA: phosphoglucosamine mutase [Streptosporangiaceae bacterium]|nr:phosphoglucosamine mutase [Streptosporangiaceae bacterium]